MLTRDTDVVEHSDSRSTTPSQESTWLFRKTEVMYTFELVAVFAKESQLHVRRLHFNGLVIGAMLHALHNDLL